MKAIRNLMTLAGFSLVLFALGAPGARGQIANPAQFAGTFTLPIDAQWGAVTLPAGNYTLRYGTQGKGNHRLVIVRGEVPGFGYQGKRVFTSQLRGPLRLLP